MSIKSIIYGKSLNECILPLPESSKCIWIMYIKDKKLTKISTTSSKLFDDVFTIDNYNICVTWNTPQSTYNVLIPQCVIEEIVEYFLSIGKIGTIRAGLQTYINHISVDIICTTIMPQLTSLFKSKIERVRKYDKSKFCLIKDDANLSNNEILEDLVDICDKEIHFNQNSYITGYKLDCFPVHISKFISCVKGTLSSINAEIVVYRKEFRTCNSERVNKITSRFINNIVSSIKDLSIHQIKYGSNPIYPFVKDSDNCIDYDKTRERFLYYDNLKPKKRKKNETS